jgi:hypothetical protein
MLQRDLFPCSINDQRWRNVYKAHELLGVLVKKNLSGIPQKGYKRREFIGDFGIQ